jgi:hypothetical protein
MPDKQTQPLLRMAIDVGRLAPAELPCSPLHEGSIEATLLEGEVDVVGHEHLGRIGDRDRFLKQCAESVPPSDHRVLESQDVEVKEP